MNEKEKKRMATAINFIVSGLHFTCSSCFFRVQQNLFYRFAFAHTHIPAIKLSLR